MTADTDLDKAALVNLGQEIDARIDELRASGQFSDVADVALKAAKIRREDIGHRLDDAIQRGDLLDALKDEVLRDFNGIRDSIEAVNDRLAADALRTSPDGKDEN